MTSALREGWDSGVGFTLRVWSMLWGWAPLTRKIPIARGWGHSTGSAALAPRQHPGSSALAESVQAGTTQCPRVEGTLFSNSVWDEHLTSFGSQAETSL